MNATVINTMASAVPGGILAQIADLSDVQLIDVHQAFVAGGYGPSITCDGCHPTDQGYELVAKTIAPYMRQAAAERGHPDGINEEVPLEKVRASYGSSDYEAMARLVNRHVHRPSF